jgi:WD40 repeat protein
MKKTDNVRTLPAPYPFAVLRGHREGVNCIDFTAENDALISGDLQGNVYYWDLSTQRTIQQWNAAHFPSIITVCSISKQRFLTSGRDGFIKCWDVNNNTAPLYALRSGCEHFCNISAINKGIFFILM